MIGRGGQGSLPREERTRLLAGLRGGFGLEETQLPGLLSQKITSTLDWGTEAYRYINMGGGGETGVNFWSKKGMNH